MTQDQWRDRNDDYTEVERRTKDIYTTQHRNYQRDSDLFHRFLSASLQPGFYGASQESFQGSNVLDAGRGSTAYFQVAMHRLGARHVTCLDLGTEWMSDLATVTADSGVPESFLTMVDGSTLDLPFDNETS